MTHPLLHRSDSMRKWNSQSIAWFEENTMNSHTISCPQHSLEQSTLCQDFKKLKKLSKKLKKGVQNFLGQNPLNQTILLKSPLFSYSPFPSS